jgi:hypothetical protein
MAEDHNFIYHRTQKLKFTPADVGARNEKYQINKLIKKEQSNLGQSCSKDIPRPESKGKHWLY